MYNLKMSLFFPFILLILGSHLLLFRRIIIIFLNLACSLQTICCCYDNNYIYSFFFFSLNLHGMFNSLMGVKFLIVSSFSLSTYLLLYPFFKYSFSLPHINTYINYLFTLNYSFKFIIDKIFILTNYF